MTKVTNNYPLLFKPTGLSLIELMVALVVTSILLLGVGTVYTASKRSYQTNDEIAALQENARFALQTLTSDIRMGGYLGCTSMKDPIVTNRVSAADGTPDPTYDISYPDSIGGSRGSGGARTPALPVTPGNIVADTDVITIRRATACSAYLTGDMATEDAAIPVTNTTNCQFTQNQAVIITNCEVSDVFRITNVPAPVGATTLEHTAGVTGNTGARLSVKYGMATSSFIMRYETLMYYIGNNAANIPSLYRRDIASGTDTELVPGVEDMVIRYGLDTTGDNSIDTVTTANAVADWGQVKNVYLRLLLRSDPVGTASKPYSFDGTDYNAANANLPADTLYRKEFVTAINLRNRTP